MTSDRTSPPPFSAPYAPDDAVIASELLQAARLDAAREQRVDRTATRLIEAIRAKDDRLGGVEDMLPEASGHARLLAQASGFLETALMSFPNVNTSATRRSRALTAEVRRRFWLPDEMLDAIYSEPVVQHFYAPDEIRAFRRQWSASR